MCITKEEKLLNKIEEKVKLQLKLLEAENKTINDNYQRQYNAGATKSCKLFIEYIEEIKRTINYNNI